jgi:hypothetical protein
VSKKKYKHSKTRTHPEGWVYVPKQMAFIDMPQKQGEPTAPKPRRPLAKKTGSLGP